MFFLAKKKWKIIWGQQRKIVVVEETTSVVRLQKVKMMMGRCYTVNLQFAISHFSHLSLSLSLSYPFIKHKNSAVSLFFCLHETPDL